MFNAIPIPTALTLSDDSAIESILTDIPLFCVGLLAFGVFTFVVVLKRVNFIVIYLYLSSFFAFIAAILDLSQVLGRGRTNAANGIDFSSISGLIKAREICLGLSLGFQYLFFWYFVAQCPPGEQSPNSVRPIDSPMRQIHSASWARWGIVGLLLKWSLLGLTFSIPILQIIWRVSTTRFGAVYVAEATIEVVVSALYILKLILNAFLSPLSPWWRSIQPNVTPFFALLISTGLGLGNLLALAFTETTLGRFLRAVEMYILILATLISAFYKVPHGKVSPRDNRLSSEKPEGSVPHATPVIAGTSAIALSSENQSNRHSHLSMLSRLSTWVLPKNTKAAENIEVQDIELGKTSTAIPAMQFGLKTEETKQLPIGLIPASDQSFEQTESLKDRPFTGVSISSYYAMDRDSSITSPPPVPAAARLGTDSPVYGLDGIIDRTRGPGTKPRPQSSASFNELLRQQTELDQSIAALRLFSPGAISTPTIPEVESTTVTPALPQISNNPKIRSNSVSTNSDIERKHESTSNRSEFSLSIFPEPPVIAEDTGASNGLDRFTGRTRVPRRGTLVVGIPSKESEDERLSVLISPNQFQGTTRFNSGGTQYDVTSFIGGLSMPMSGSMSTNDSIPLVKEESEGNSVANARPNTRPMILASSMPFLIPSEVVRNELPRELKPSKQDLSVSLRPLLLGTSSQRVVPVTLPSSTMVPIGFRRTKGGLPSNPRHWPVISAPTAPTDDEQMPGVFERPRPPPLR